MSAEHYIKTLCPLCDGSIEFPAQAFGEMVNCPHCQNLIELGKPSEPPINSPHCQNLFELIRPSEPQQEGSRAPSVNQKWGKWNVASNKKLLAVVITFAGVITCAILAAQDNNADSQAHPLAYILGSTIPALVFGGIWYFRIVRKEKQNKSNQFNEPASGSTIYERMIRGFIVICFAVVLFLILSGTALFIYEDSQQRKAEALQRAQQVDQEVKRLNAVSSQAMARQSAAAFLDAPAARFTPPTPNQIEPQKNANGTPAGAWASTLVPVMTENNLFLDPATGKLYRVLNGKIFEETNPYAGMTPEQIDLLEIKLLAQMRSHTANQGPPIAAYHPMPTPDYTSDFYQHQFQPQQISSPSFVTPSVVGSASSYDPNSLANPYGAGSPYKAGGLMNPYSQNGSPYSSKSWRNPYATDTPKLYDSQGNYRGKLSSNPYDPDSVSNPYGKYGSPYSSDSINNPYGLGSPFRTDPIYVVPSP